MDKNVMFKISYGLFVLSTRDGEKQSGCIVNTVIQHTTEPNQISVTVNKSNYTLELIKKSGIFTVSVLDESAPFSVFENFGFRSSRNCDKFADFTDKKAGDNGVYYITKGANSHISARVTEMKDLGSHMLIIAEVTDGEILSDIPSMTYDYYFKNVKPKPKKVQSSGKVWVCKICGYVYDESKTGIPFDELPDDFICPLCKHPKSDFVLQE